MKILALALMSLFTFGCGHESRAGDTHTTKENILGISGWKQSENMRTFEPDNLFEYIDGAAELYLSYNFRELSVGQYSGEKDASVTVEIYHHQTPVDAFGMYSQERPIDGQYLKGIGAEAYLESPVLNFVLRDAYVKISGYELGDRADEILQAFGKKIASDIGGDPVLPATLTLFPEEGKKAHSEQYVAKNLFGYDFLHSGFTADYSVGKAEFQLFIIQGADSKDCEDMLRRLRQPAGQAPMDLKEGSYTLTDPYHGDISLFWSGTYIGGAMKLGDAALRTRLLKTMSELIQKAN